MSRNGAGVYTLAAGNPVVTGTTISSTWANNTLSDIATALTQSLAKDGQTTPTANIPLGGFKITGLGAPTTAGDALAYGSSLGAVTATTGTFSGNVQMASLNGGQLAGLRNNIINGDMRVAQRGTVSSGISTVTYTLDRWIVFTGGAALSVSQAAGDGGLFQYALNVVGAVGNTSCNITQRIEQRNAYPLASKQVTISARIYASASFTPTWVVASANAADTFTTTTNVATGTFSALSIGWNDVTFTTTLNSACQNGFQVSFVMGATTSGNKGLTGVQLEVGPVATPFEQRPIGMELALCQRYLPRVSNGAGFAYALNSGQFMFPFEVTPRVSATGITVLAYGLMNCTGTPRTGTTATFVRGDGNSGVINIGSAAGDFTATTGQGATLLSGDYLFTGCEL